VGVTYADWTDVTLVAPIPLPTTLQPRVTEYVNQASVRLRAIVPGLDNRLASGNLEADLVKGVVVDAVLRLVYNPTGAQSQTAGPFNTSKAGGVAGDAIVFDPDQISLLLLQEETVPGTFGVSVAIRPGLPQIKTLPGLEGTPFAASVGLSERLDAFRGYPYIPEAIQAYWGAYGYPDWYR
jgi:hypothetical protein